MRRTNRGPRINAHLPEANRSDAHRSPRAPVIRIVPIAGEASHRLLRTLAGFGMGVREHAPPAPAAADPTLAAKVVDAAQTPGTIVLLQGESGCGKSTLLHAAHRAARAQGVMAKLLDLGAWPHSSEQSLAATLIDRVPGPRGEALALLSAMGLGDALQMARHPDTLSEGQSARLRIACAIAGLREPVGRDPRPALLLIDEFASVLDRTNARTLCHTLAKLVRRSPRLSLVLATAHDDIRGWLSPDLTICLQPAWEAAPSRSAA